MTRGKQAIERALDINGDLSLAHHLYAYVEVEEAGMLARRWSGCSIASVMPRQNRSCSPDWFTPVAIAGCSRHQWRRTSVRIALIRPSRPAWRRRSC